MRIEGIKEFKEAIRRSPGKVQDEAQKLFIRNASFIDRFLSSSAWRVGGGAAGVPFRSGNLLDNARDRVFTAYSLIISTDLNTAPYGLYVHDGTRKMKARPYYDAAVEKTEAEREDAINKFMDEVVKDLAK